MLINKQSLIKIKKLLANKSIEDIIKGNDHDDNIYLILMRHIRELQAIADNAKLTKWYHLKRRLEMERSHYRLLKNLSKYLYETRT